MTVRAEQGAQAGDLGAQAESLGAQAEGVWEHRQGSSRLFHSLLISLNGNRKPTVQRPRRRLVFTHKLFLK